MHDNENMNLFDFFASEEYAEMDRIIRELIGCPLMIEVPRHVDDDFDDDDFDDVFDDDYDPDCDADEPMYTDDIPCEIADAYYRAWSLVDLLASCLARYFHVACDYDCCNHMHDFDEED